MDYKIKKIATIKEFDGFLILYQHQSYVCQCTMQFTIYLPPQTKTQNVPVLYWLSGLTCTDENFRVKAGAQRYAAEYGLALVIPDTSPRGEYVPDDEHYDLGQGAGFYINAKQAPWSANYQMYDYITQVLPQVIHSLNLPLTGKQSISGHSMGGHGALMIALKNPDKYCCVSAFAPICNPMNSTWGQKAYHRYLGDNIQEWREYDTCALLADCKTAPPMFVDQGTADEFYPHGLLTENLQSVCADNGIEITLRFQDDYDHSFHFIATFIGEHLRWHADFLKKP